MVEQQALPAKDAVDLLPAGPKSVDDQQLIGTLVDSLQRYSPPANSVVRDVLIGRYRIELSTPLPEFDTKTARAFSAVDMMDNSKKMFALVCRPGSVQRHHAIETVTGVELPNMITLWASGVVSLSQPEEERFVLFYSRPVGKKLSDLMAGLKHPLSDTFISKSILGPLIVAIGQLAELGIAHGAVRPDNIYYGDIPILGDYLSEPCGYGQPFYFEPVDRMQAMPSAKGESSSAQDYYALAILVLYLLYGQKHFDVYTVESLPRRILRDGAYMSLLRTEEPPELFNDFLRGLLSGNVNERWNFRNLKQWVEGKRSNIMVPATPSEALRPFEFAGSQASTKRELAHLLFQNWPLTQELMRTDTLVQWVAVSLRNKDLAEVLKRIKRVISETNVKNEIQISEQLMRMLMLFDPSGPIRINNLSFHLDGIDSLGAELMASKSVNELKTLSKFIEHSMGTHWHDMQRGGPEYTMPDSINAISLKLDRLRLFIRNNGFGFGQERMLYELNPEMPCQSPLFTNSYVNSLPALLKQLDRLAPRLYKEMDPIDAHIAAFIANRIGILHEVKLHELIPHPSLTNHKGVIALRFLALAQDRCGDMQLPGLAQWLAIRIIPALDTVKSRTLRAKVKALMAERAKTGYTQLMSDLVIESNYAIADMSGFGRATRVFRENIERMSHYRQDAVIDRMSARLGFGIAKFFAYVVFGLVVYKIGFMK